MKYDNNFTPEEQKMGADMLQILTEMVPFFYHIDARGGIPEELDKKSIQLFGLTAKNVLCVMIESNLRLVTNNFENLLDCCHSSIQFVNVTENGIEPMYPLSHQALANFEKNWVIFASSVTSEKIVDFHQLLLNPAWH
jgi:hypothetical protein